MSAVENSPLEKGDKKVIRAWVMYDWANSVFQLTILSAIFPIYFNSVTRHGNDFNVDFFGFKIINTVLYSWSIAAAYLFVAILSPMFSSIADYTGRRKFFMKIFTWIGSISCGMLFFFDPNHIELGIISFTLATIGYGGSIVFYNSFLPVIAAPEAQDRISARGYSMGYLGGVVLLVINLVVIMGQKSFGITDDTLPARMAFVTVFLWWIGFSQITFRKLPKYTYGHGRESSHVLLNGYRELRVVFKHVLSSRRLTLFLFGFFFMMMGTLTVMFMAATFGEKEVGLKADVLIPTILVIQLVGSAGSYFFAWISSRIGNFKALIISVAWWVLVCIAAYFITDAFGFIIVAFFIGAVMGGSQALARSTYSKMLPETKDHTSFFSFYDVMEKLATVGGTFSFGLIEALTGNMRISVVAIASFFILSLFFFLMLFFSQKGKLALK
ncbi:MAG: MFS transporter [Bacteroidota bacterium]